MKENISALEEPLMQFVSRVRGTLPENAAAYPDLNGATAEAIRKRAERLVEKGYFLTSLLPSKRQFFRLSKKGAGAMGCPPSYAASPTAGILMEALSISALACRKTEFLFPKRAELQAILNDLAEGEVQIPLRMMTNRFVLRTIGARGKAEVRLDFWLAEMRSPLELIRRVEIVSKNLRTIPLFEMLMEHGLMGISIPVASEGVMETLASHSSAFPTHSVVVNELNHLVQ